MKRRRKKRQQKPLMELNLLPGFGKAEGHTGKRGGRDGPPPNWSDPVKKIIVIDANGQRLKQARFPLPGKEGGRGWGWGSCGRTSGLTPHSVTVIGSFGLLARGGRGLGGGMEGVVLFVRITSKALLIPPPLRTAGFTTRPLGGGIFPIPRLVSHWPITTGWT